MNFLTVSLFFLCIFVYRFRADWLFPGPREKLQGGFLEGFDLFSGQFSVNFPAEISRKNHRKSLKNPFEAF